MTLLKPFKLILEIFLLPVLVPSALWARFFKAPVDVGLGPMPLINNLYHKKALEREGYSAETFVSHSYFITDQFDYKANLKMKGLLVYLIPYWLFLRSLFRYRMLYIYFDGGPLGPSVFLWRIEPWLYKLAGKKILVMPYGSDVQVMTRSKNLKFKHSLAKDYPGHRLRRKRISQNVDMWLKWADHVIAGNDWVDYLESWDTLMLGHFSIDTDVWLPSKNSADFQKPLRILHAPNHRNIKGTLHFVKAVEELKSEGVKIELILCEKLPNSEIKKQMENVDVVADQLIMGWYAMFAIEAMSMGKPVLCHFRQDFIELFVSAGLLEKDELPLIECNPMNVKEVLRDLASNRDKLEEIGKRSRQFVKKHHSLESVGRVFGQINRGLLGEPLSP